MSEPYTPTTARVRGFYRNATAWTFDHDPQPHIAAMMEKQAAEFDRWLAKVKADARSEGQAEAWDEGYDRGHVDGFAADGGPDSTHDNYRSDENPYRNGAGRG